MKAYEQAIAEYNRCSHDPTYATHTVSQFLDFADCLLVAFMLELMLDFEKFCFTSIIGIYSLLCFEMGEMYERS